MGLLTVDDIFIKLEVTSVYGKLAGDPGSPLVLGLHGWSQRNGWHTWKPLMDPLEVSVTVKLNNPVLLKVTPPGGTKVLTPLSIPVKE